jgi:Tfp pilus assembly protein PilZ
MSRVLLQSASQNDAEFLKRLFNLHLIDCQVSNDNITSRSLLTHDRFDLFVMAASRFYPREYRFLLDLRRKRVDTNVLILAGKLGFEHFFEHRERKGIHLLEKPFDDADMMSIAKKLLQNPSLQQQKFKRYSTEVSSRIEGLLTKQSQPAVMRNLSRGGAFIELKDRPQFHVGDLVRLHIELSDVDRKYSLSGRVVWETDRTKSTGQPGFGMEFVQTQEMYGLLKERL